MKRLLLILVLFLSVNAVFSQKYEKKIAASDKNIEDPKKGIIPKTWISRGELFYEIAVAPKASLEAGISNEMYKLVMGQDVIDKAAQESEMVNNKRYTVHVFDDKKVYLDSAIVVFWDVLKYDVPNPMQKSYEAYIKAKSLDTGGKSAKKLKENFGLLAALSKTEAFNKLSVNKYSEAVELFSLSVDCSEETGVIDTLSIYYAGVLAVETKNYAIAEKYFKKALAVGYIADGDTYAYFAQALEGLGKIDEARKILEAGFKIKPENQQLIIALINNYMSSGKDPKDIIPLITKAQEVEPQNINLYIVEGDLRERLSDIEGATKCYEKAMEVDPDDFFGFYKLGLLYYNIGAKYSEQAAINEKNQKEYDRFLELADTELKKSLPFLERAFELNPVEVSTIQALKEINFRFRMENDTYKQNAEKYTKLLNEKNN
jgi:tetratricopeptide (TPR) repeat protein